MRLRVAAFVAASALVCAPAGGAQATAWLPLDDPAYLLVDALIARGQLRALSAIDRPYTTGELRRALAGVDTTATSRTLVAWVREIDVALRRFEPRRDSLPAARMSVYALGSAQTMAAGDPMREHRGATAEPGAGIRLVVGAGPAVAGARLQLDNRLKRDPDFGGSKLRGVAGRTEDAWVAGQWRYGHLFFGRQQRNWGPYTLPGLQLGSHAYSWDHVAGRLGTERLALTSIIARLDPSAGDTTRERHVAMHRLSTRVGAVEIAASEAVVYGGVGRGTELAYANPLSLLQLAQYNEGRDGNVSYAADVAWRPRHGGVVAAQLFVDDVQIDRCDPACAEPPSYGVTATVEGMPLAGDQRWFAAYTRVSHLAYRTPQPWERHASFDVSLGRATSDYDETRAGVDIGVRQLPPLRLYAAYRRQGEGDYRDPFPQPDRYAETPAFLAGTPVRTLRVALHGGAVRWRGRLGIVADVGFNVVRDRGHVAGDDWRGVQGSVRATLELGAVGGPL